MRLLLMLLIFVSLAPRAEECVFDEAAYIGFVSEYRAQHDNATLDRDGRTLIINRGDEVIVVQGGGCVHLGVAIELRNSETYAEAAFLQKVLSLSVEFGDWLINTRALEASINNGDYQIIDGVYFVNVDAMTVFSASRREQGGILVDFYIN